MIRNVLNGMVILPIACLLALGTGCGSSGSGTDVGGDPDAMTDVATDLGEDPGTDLGTDPGSDLGGDPGTEPDADVGTDTGLDVGEDAPDARPDVEPEYPWESGCEGTWSGATWGPVDDDLIFLRDPFLQMSDRTSVTVVWRTLVPTEDPGCVDVVYAEVARTACGTADANGQYEVAIDDLPAATEITYAAYVGDVRGTERTFRTMPDRPVPVKFAMFADAHTNEAALRAMAAIALAEGVDFAVSVGDMTGSGLPEEFDVYLKGLNPLGSRVTVWHVPGNHDEKNLRGYLDTFVLPQGNQDEKDAGLGETWWDMRIGNVWLGGGWIRDFYLSAPDTEWGQVGWFRRQFEKRHFQTAQWRLFFIHQPPYVLQWNDECKYTGEHSLRVALLPLMAENNIKASFHGHMHGIEYGEIDGVWTFVAGGLGGGLDPDRCPQPEEWPDPWHSLYGVHNFTIIETGCDKMTVRYMDLEGNELIRVEIPADAS